MQRSYMFHSCVLKRTQFPEEIKRANDWFKGQMHLEHTIDGRMKNRCEKMPRKEEGEVNMTHHNPHEQGRH
ncbi:hypothetical protein Mapa_016200 [Marchantia paleacea]|nr:hypothetical protein Mapa_016200 [Marchantia paleacea]